MNSLSRGAAKLLIVLFLAMPCLAQQAPAWEFFVGYSGQQTNVREYYKSTPSMYSIRNRVENLTGWDLSVTENMNRWFGGTLDVSGHYLTPQLLGSNNREVMHSILYGPRGSFRKAAFVPFGHVLFGATRSSVQVTPVGPHSSLTGFATAAGGGVDLNLRNKAAIRVLQWEYFHANALGSNQTNYRASAGIVFYVGKGK